MFVIFILQVQVGPQLLLARREHRLRGPPRHRQPHPAGHHLPGRHLRQHDGDRRRQDDLQAEGRHQPLHRLPRLGRSHAGGGRAAVVGNLRGREMGVLRLIIQSKRYYFSSIKG